MPIQDNGTPLHQDDSQYTVVQKYNSKLDRFVNFYYYWVKDKTTLPESQRDASTRRKNTVAFVANIISNPRLIAKIYYSITDTNKFLLHNVSNLNGVI